jgi:hypothetical protein
MRLQISQAYRVRAPGGKSGNLQDAADRKGTVRCAALLRGISFTKKVPFYHYYSQLQPKRQHVFMFFSP